MGIDGWRIKAGSPGIPMSTPQNLSPVALEAISEISVAMVEQSEACEVFEDGSDGLVVQVLQSIFANYLHDKLA